MRVPSLGDDGYLMAPQLFSDSSIGTLAFGDGIAQLSLTDRKWVVRVKRPLISAFIRDDRGQYWVGTREGLRRLSIAGSEWRLAPAGLDGSVAALAIDPAGYLIAAIDGRGVFRARLP